ncbi:MAG TPA: hypothetical protein VIY73_27775 [Polyangiaceae bacterium]
MNRARSTGSTRSFADALVRSAGSDRPAPGAKGRVLARLGVRPAEAGLPGVAVGVLAGVLVLLLGAGAAARPADPTLVDRAGAMGTRGSIEAPPFGIGDPSNTVDDGACGGGSSSGARTPGTSGG